MASFGDENADPEPSGPTAATTASTAAAEPALAGPTERSTNVVGGYDGGGPPLHPFAVGATDKSGYTQRKAGLPKQKKYIAVKSSGYGRPSSVGRRPATATAGSSRPSGGRSSRSSHRHNKPPPTTRTTTPRTGQQQRRDKRVSGASFTKPTHSSLRSLSSGYESDDVSVGSARSVGSGGTGRGSASSSSGSVRSVPVTVGRGVVRDEGKVLGMGGGGGPRPSSSRTRSTSRRRQSEMPSPSRPVGVPLAGGGGRSRRMSVSAPSSPAFRTGDLGGGGGAVEELRRASSRPRERGAAGGGSSWAQQQREQLLKRQARASSRLGSRSPAAAAATASASGSEITDANVMAKYDEINRSLKRLAPSPTASLSSASLGRDDDGGSNKAARTSEAATPGKSAAAASSASAAAASPSLIPTGIGKAHHPPASPSRTPVSQLKKTTGLLARYSSPRRSGARGGSKPSTPSSYGKVVALSGGAATPIIVRELFDAHRNRASSVLAELADFNPNALSSRALADQVFASGSGISDEEVRRVLTSKATKVANKWELKKQLEATNAAMKRLKDTMNLLHRGKNKYLAGAVEAERVARSGWARALHKAKELDDDRAALKKLAKQLEAEAVTLRDDSKDARRDLDQSTERVRSLEAELGPLRDNLAAAEKAHTDVSIALAVAEARAEEAARQAEGWRAEIASVEKSKAEAIEQSEKAAAATVEQEAAELREEVTSLRTRMQAREEELGRLVGTRDGESGADESSASQMDTVKQEIDRLRGKVGELEAELALRTAELEKVKADNEAAAERAATKDRDMSELAKGLREVQQSGRDREEEANASRKVAEEKAADMERLYTEARHEISVLSHEKDQLTESLENMKKDYVAAEDLVKNLKEEVSALKSDMNTHTSQVQVERELRARAEQSVEEERRERIATSAQMVAMSQDHARAEAQWKEASQGIERKLRDEIVSLGDMLQREKDEHHQAKEKNSGLEGECASLKTALNDERNIADAKNVEEMGRLMGEINVLKKRLKAEEEKAASAGMATQSQVMELEDQLRESQAERRRMHNLVQELRGNVRVFARLRPFLPDDGVDDDNAQPSIVPRSDAELKLIKSSQEYKFTFDRVFSPSVGQETVFQEVSEFVQSALDGYNVCLFSYGQTGSGKTHTMQGSGVGQMRGIIPRSIEQIGQYKERLERDGWRYEVVCSYCEIYKEAIRDLLRDDKAEDVKHEIKVDNDGRHYVSNLTMQSLDPSDTDAVNEVMHQASKHRSVGSTDMNAVSSRSHAVFTLHLRAIHAEEKQQISSMLNLVDLAGSERLDRSGATGMRAKETMAINKSLASLTDVFVAIGRKAGHVPFRNSKLTYLLQPCLSGDGKTLMIVNLSPTETSAQESLCSLRFASQVNKCELGRAKRAIEDVTADEETPYGTPSGRSVKRPLVKSSSRMRSIMGRK